MTWSLIFILTYSDPTAGNIGGAYTEHATVAPEVYASQAECEAAGSVKLANLNWSSADGSQLRWMCSQKPAVTY